MAFPVDGYTPGNVIGTVNNWNRDLTVEIRADSLNEVPLGDLGRSAVLVGVDAVKGWMETEFPTDPITTKVRYEAWQDE